MLPVWPGSLTAAITSSWREGNGVANGGVAVFLSVEASFRRVPLLVGHTAGVERSVKLGVHAQVVELFAN